MLLTKISFDALITFVCLLFLFLFSDPIYDVDNFSKQADLGKKFEKGMGIIVFSLGLNWNYKLSVGDKKSWWCF